MPKFNRIATVEFAISGSDHRIKISNLPYRWNSDETQHIDQPAVFEAIAYLRELGVTAGLDTISVCTCAA